MKRLILSDLHFGNPLFRYELQLIKLLSSTNFDEIIICGDTLDTWESSIDRIISKYNFLIDLFNKLGSTVIIIHGNHDPPIEKLKSIFNNCQVYNSYVYNNNIVIHGSEFDNLINKYSYIARYLGYFNWIFERCNLDIKSFFRELYYSISAKRQKLYYNSLVSNIEKSAVEKYSKDYKLVIMGHTHMPKIINNYINCGDMIHNYTYIIDDNDKFGLFYFI
jgi:UDP-2,3-diacylglucosamine pyrophosphatase LpxH